MEHFHRKIPSGWNSSGTGVSRSSGWRLFFSLEGIYSSS